MAEGSRSDLVQRLLAERRVRGIQSALLNLVPPAHTQGLNPSQVSR